MNLSPVSTTSEFQFNWISVYTGPWLPLAYFPAFAFPRIFSGEERWQPPLPVHLCSSLVVRPGGVVLPAGVLVDGDDGGGGGDISTGPDSPLLSCTNILTLPLFLPDLQNIHTPPTRQADWHHNLTDIMLSIKFTDWQISWGIWIPKILFICNFDCLETSLKMTKLVEYKLWLDSSDLSDSRM